MADSNSVELRINVDAVIARLNFEKDNILFMMNTEPNEVKRFFYSEALIHLTAAAQFIYKAKEL